MRDSGGGGDHEKVMDTDLRIHSIFKEIKLIAQESLPPRRVFPTLATKVINLWSSIVLVFLQSGHCYVLHSGSLEKKWIRANSS